MAEQAKGLGAEALRVLVDQVVEEVGMSPAAWDTVDPNEIVVAVAKSLAARVAAVERERDALREVPVLIETPNEVCDGTMAMTAGEVVAAYGVDALAWVIDPNDIEYERKAAAAIADDAAGLNIHEGGVWLPVMVREHRVRQWSEMHKARALAAEAELGRVGGRGEGVG